MWNDDELVTAREPRCQATAGPASRPSLSTDTHATPPYMPHQRCDVSSARVARHMPPMWLGRLVVLSWSSRPAVETLETASLTQDADSTRTCTRSHGRPSCGSNGSSR